LVLAAGIAAAHPSLPLRFEPNGADEYLFFGRNYRLSVNRTELVLRAAGASANSRDVRMRLAGADPGARIEGAGLMSSQTNYLIGSASHWRRGVPNYSRVRIRGAYPGIDLVVYGAEGSLEFDFEIAPGADPRRIRFDVEGAAELQVEDGALSIAGPAGKIRWSRPVVYQEDRGARRPVPGEFRLRGKRVAFEVGRYDRGRKLVIDPVLSFSTYFGNIGNEAARGIGVDGAGNVYIAGYTTSRNLPVSTNAVQPAYGGQTTQYQTGDAFVAKFSSTGALLAMTYLGGARDDLASSLAVDAAGNVYVTGYTNSVDFPFSPKAYQPRMAGAGGNTLFTVGDAFVVKLNSGLSQILYSTCIGGLRDEAGIAIAIDASGAAYIAGITLSADFPTTPGAYQTLYRGAGGQPNTDFGGPFFITGDAFVSKLSPDGSQLVFSTFLGGTLDDAATAIAVDSAGNVYVGGFTVSRNFPVTPQALQTSFRGSEQQNEFYNLGDAFITKLNPTGTALVYSTYLGGSGDDAVAAIAVDASGSVYATGATTSSDFPVTAGVFQRFNAGPFSDDFAERIVGDAFAVKLKPDGSGLVYGTYLGGSADDSGKAIAIDAAGNAYIGGNTASTDFPVTSDGFQKAFAGGGGEHNNGDLEGDGFVAVLDAAGARETYGSYLGGSMDDGIQGIALDPAGNIYVTGVTMASNFPVLAGAYQPRYGGAGSSGRVLGDSFVAKFGASSALTAAPASVTVSYALGAPKPSPVTVAISAPAAMAFTVSVPASAPWLTVTPASGQTPATLTVNIDPGGLAAGPYNATITISSTGTPALTVPVNLTVTGTGAIPQFTVAGVVNSASGAAGPVAPGEILTIFGSNMGPQLTTLVLGSDGRVASTLAGTRVLFDGVAAPMIYTSAGQLSCVTPYSVGGKTTTQIQISYNNVLSTVLSLPVAASAPGLYTVNQQGSGQAAALNQDNTFNSSSNPAATGSIVVVYGTGEGQTIPAVPDGTVATSVVPKPQLSVTATVGGKPATVQYAGTAPSFVVGAFQLNLVIPDGISPGDAAVVVTVGTVSSKAGVTVAVK
jgi:uncharacterized protein (TIGR03437 family)